jgi:hypothetical protein
LRYAVYTLLETWGLESLQQDNIHPKIKFSQISKNRDNIINPLEYRALLYPDAYDESFRDWHKLDWHLNDFSVWGHSFDKLLSPAKYFTTNPTFFALYEGS